MSTQLVRVPRSAAGTAPTSTRQQLEELDALLQRMLDLPVHPNEDEPEPEPRRAESLRERGRPAAARIETRSSEPQTPVVAPPPRSAQTAPTPPPRNTAQRSYPASYMVVESSTPDFLTQPMLSDQQSGDVRLGPKMVAGEPLPAAVNAEIDMPVPGGRHDLEADEPVDPAGDLARLQAELGTSPEEWVPFHSSWQPSEQTWKPLVESWQQAKSGSATTVATPPVTAKLPSAIDDRPKLRDLLRASVPPPPPVSTPTVPPPLPTQTPRATPNPTVPSPSLAARPLVWFNSAFDLLLVPLGSAGQWFQGKGGGAVLATVGFLCLVGATSLAVADWFGWTW